ncbi:MAG: GTP cyclohydrolase II RibA [Betaproteobacteria bacterium]|nr:GTP cyclohydrolase II RibA [Betaproteobacteria bacterium]
MNVHPARRAARGRRRGPGHAGRTVSVRNEVCIPVRDDARARFVTFDGLPDGAEHFAVRFEGVEPRDPPIVRMHSECITGDVFASRRCDCGDQLRHALDVLHAAGGFLLYLRQEGRGIGLVAKLDAYRLQDAGADTFAANRALDLPADARDYACGAQMLAALGVRRVRLMTNNPDKVAQLTAHGIEVVERVSAGTFPTHANRHYLEAKYRLTGHALDL